MFINFKDFKGKVEGAMSKMVGDLKKFGLPNVKNLKIEILKQGYGEVVCQLIDELVNMELYRREFEFLQPFPSFSNFVLFRVIGRDAGQLKRDLEQHGILVRYFAKEGVDNCIRISAGRPEDTVRLVAALREMEK